MLKPPNNIVETSLQLFNSYSDDNFPVDDWITLTPEWNLNLWIWNEKKIATLYIGGSDNYIRIREEPLKKTEASCI